jgi:hypothetical protein
MAVLSFNTLSYANDHEVLVARNELGTRITLTNHDCHIKELKGSKIAVTSDTIKQVFGCWFKYNGKIYAAWFYEGNVYKEEYDPSVFVTEKLL